MSLKITHEKIIIDHPNLYLKYKQVEYLAIPEGWNQLLYDLSSKLEPFCNENLYATEIKEKHNALRLYMSEGISKEISLLIHEAERNSFTLCFRCGSAGELRKKGIYCNICYENMKKEFSNLRNW